ncbi:MAG: sigma 54-interacting transcriptional regulator, partial [SAR324 cluster bacterium]|nr:sigma 54-interacting transcriptional regulator [SAR324 cluster bacterium]
MKKKEKQKDSQIKLETNTDSILESISDGVFTVDPEWKITSFNRAAEMITGVSREEAIGKTCREVFQSNMCDNECALRLTLNTGQPIIGKSGFISNSKGKRTPISLSTAVLQDQAGQVMGGAETFRDLSEVEALRKQLKGRFRLGDLISHSPAMQQIFEFSTSVAASSSTVVIQGETGTGKELLAKAIHMMSPRAKEPFVALNCAALPDTLLESELFGYKKGAFTGADRDKPGRFAMAGKGTLFLDEIGEITPALQVRLLRVLQERCYEPLGDTASKKMRARIITATHQNLSDMVEKGDFRQDLFYRINVVNIELLPLRQRKEDIPILVDHFIGHFNLLQGKNISGVSSDVASLLMAHDWPGNVRELENIIERAFVICTDEWIGMEHLPKSLLGFDSTV